MTYWMRALPAMYSISRARKVGIVVTATPPAFSTAYQAAASIGWLPERSITRLPGTRPSSSTSRLAMRLARASVSAQVQTSSPNRNIGLSAYPASACRSSSSTAALKRGG